jgi:hypothetical protein
VWDSEVALSPTRSLELSDTSTTRTDAWRSYGTAIPAGEDRVLDLRWFWKYDVDAGGEFRARLQLSTSEETGVDLVNPSLVYDFLISGETSDFEMFQTSLAIPDAIRSFDLTFFSGGSFAATGHLHIDDISVAISEFAALDADFDDDGDTDGSDLLVWQQTLGANVTPGTGADGSGNGLVDSSDLDLWKAAFGGPPASPSMLPSTSEQVPEPSGQLLWMVAVACGIARYAKERPRELAT